MDKLEKSIEKLESDWEFIKKKYNLTQNFVIDNKIIKIKNGVYSPVFNLSFINDKFFLKEEGDFGEMYCETFDVLEDLEMYLFSPVFDTFISDFLSKNIISDNKYVDEYVISVVSNNLRFEIWNDISMDMANKVNKLYYFSLRFWLSQIMNNQHLNNTSCVKLFEKQDIEFTIEKIEDKYEVCYKGLSYLI